MLREWPVNGEFRVVPGHGPFTGGLIKVAGLVEKIGLIFQDQKAVSKAGGDVELMVVAIGEFTASPKAE